VHSLGNIRAGSRTKPRGSGPHRDSSRQTSRSRRGSVRDRARRSANAPRRNWHRNAPKACVKSDFLQLGRLIQGAASTTRSLAMFAATRPPPHRVRVADVRSTICAATLATLDDSYRPVVRIPGPVILPSRSFQKPGILALGPLSASAPAHHVDIKQF